MNVKHIILKVQPLTTVAFAPFGDVIEVDDDHHHYPINNGTTERYHDLAEVDVLEQGGRTLINIFRGQPFQLPIRIKLMERHPLSSQAFIPMSDKPFLVVVAEKGDNLDANNLFAFISNGQQGVNYHRAVWHHPLLSLESVSDFLVVDRGGNGENCDEVFFDDDQVVTIDNLP